MGSIASKTGRTGSAAAERTGLIVVDQHGSIGFSSGMAEALPGRRPDGADSVFELFAQESHPELRRLLRAAFAGERSAARSVQARLIGAGSGRVRLTAAPLLGRTSGRPVAAALEIDGDIPTRADGRFCRAELVTETAPFSDCLERALRHHAATGVEYLLCTVALAGAADEGARGAWLDRLLIRLRAGDTVGACELPRVRLLLSGCGSAQLAVIRTKLQAVSEPSHVAAELVGAAPAAPAFRSARAWLAATAPAEALSGPVSVAAAPRALQP